MQVFNLCGELFSTGHCFLLPTLSIHTPKKIPVVLQISPERGMLMASALIAYLLVAAVSVLGISVALWSRGIGPSIGV